MGVFLPYRACLLTVLATAWSEQWVQLPLLCPEAELCFPQGTAISLCSLRQIPLQQPEGSRPCSPCSVQCVSPHSSTSLTAFQLLLLMQLQDNPCPIAQQVSLSSPHWELAWNNQHQQTQGAWPWSRVAVPVPGVGALGMGWDGWAARAQRCSVTPHPRDEHSTACLLSQAASCRTGAFSTDTVLSQRAKLTPGSVILWNDWRLPGLAPEEHL